MKHEELYQILENLIEAARVIDEARVEELNNLYESKALEIYSSERKKKDLDCEVVRNLCLSDPSNSRLYENNIRKAEEMLSRLRGDELSV